MKEIETRIWTISPPAGKSIEHAVLNADEIIIRNEGTNAVTINRSITLTSGEELRLGSLGGIDRTRYEFVFAAKDSNSKLGIITRTLK